MLVLVGPVVYASAVLRITGGVAVSIAESLAILPHALYFSGDPDPLFRLAAFGAVSILLAGFIGRELNMNERLQQEHFRLEQFLSQTIDAQDLVGFQEMNLFRIAQEPLNNARKHSQASKTWLSLTISDIQVQLQVKDNGIGFAVPAQERLLSQGKFGLIGITERVRLGRGTVRFESAPGRGTTVTVKMPTLGPQSESSPTEYDPAGPPGSHDRVPGATVAKEAYPRLFPTIGEQPEDGWLREQR